MDNVYLLWLKRRDEAVTNAQLCYDEGKDEVGMYWENRAKLANLMLDKVMSETTIGEIA